MTRLFALVLALVVSSLAAAEAVAAPPSRSPPTSLTASAGVVVELAIGEIDLEVEGWAKAKIEVDEDIAGGWTARLEEDGGRVTVRLDGPPGVPASGTLKLRVPKAAELQVTARGGDVRGTNLHGRASVATIGGDVTLVGPATRIEIATTSGKVKLDGANGRMDVATVSGDVTLAGVRGELHVETVSGDVAAFKARLDRTQVATISGEVEIAAELRKGPHRIDTNSGDVKVVLPRTIALRIAVSSFSGTILDAFADPPAKHEDSHKRELGKGGGTLEISTFSGDVTLAPQAAS